MKDKKSELKELTYDEKKLYLGTNAKRIKYMRKTLHKRYLLWRFMYYFRLCQYFNELKRDKSSVFKIKRKLIRTVFWYFDRKRNEYSYKSGVEIGIQCRIGKECAIWHGGVVINGEVGSGCTFRGNNVIGQKGGPEFLRNTPIIGNGVDVGFGASIIGGIHIADDCIIGAGAVVTKSVEQKGAVLVGVPARVISIREDINNR